MNPIAWRRLLAGVFILIAIVFPVFQATSFILSSGSTELGLPPIVRVEYSVTDDLSRIPQEPRIRYGFFFTVGLVSILCFAAGRLSHATSVHNSNVAEPSAADGLPGAE